MFRSILMIFLLLGSLAAWSQPRMDATIRRNIVSNLNQDQGCYAVIVDAQGRSMPAGSAAPKGKPDHILVGGFDQVHQSEEEGGAVVLGNLVITKAAGESTALLLEAMDKGEVLKSVDLVIFRRSDDKEVEELRITLANARVVGMVTRFKRTSTRLPGSSVVEEVVTFAYDSITWTLEDGTSSYQTSR